MKANPNLKDLLFSQLSEDTLKRIEKSAEQFKLAMALVARLRGPDGCPWDREQDHLSIRSYLIEEAYEVLDVLDLFEVKTPAKQVAAETPKSEPIQANGSFSANGSQLLKEELGDLLLQILLHSEFTNERHEFDMGDVAEGMAQKLTFRHPHVFGDQKAKDSDQVLKNWEELKKKEGRKSLLDGMPKNLPSLQKAARIGEKAHRLGFDWPDWTGPWAKVKEELAELEEAIAEGDPTHTEEELGDLFFALSNLARHLKIMPEDAHRKAISKFESRFRKVELEFEKMGRDIQSASMKELDEVWEKIKADQENKS